MDNDRTMSKAEMLHLRREQIKQEDIAVLNLLYRTATLSVDAAQAQIAAMPRLSQSERDRRMEVEQKYLKLAKRPWLKDQIPPSHTALIAFSNQLEQAIKKYKIVERNGQFIAL
jgi:hypothetical protein